MLSTADAIDNAGKPGDCCLRHLHQPAHATIQSAYATGRGVSDDQALLAAFLFRAELKLRGVGPRKTWQDDNALSKHTSSPQALQLIQSLA